MGFAKLNRRKFIRDTAAIGRGVALSAVWHMASVAKGYVQRDIYCYQRPSRILQTVLREPDASSYDPKGVIAHISKSIKYASC